MASLYVSAPTSPSWSRLENMQFYSAPTSPIQSYGFDKVESGSDGFEFGVSPSVFNDTDWEASQRFDCVNSLVVKQSERVDSFSKMAFADELFCNGQVLPLKLPPGRLKSRTGPNSTVTSPKSISPVLQISFGRRNTWNDNFDPFTVALENVKDEKKGRKSVHRRSQSLSPFRSMSISKTTNLPPAPQHKEISSKSLHFVQPKGSVYTKWVHRESMARNRTASSKQNISKMAKTKKNENSEEMKTKMKKMKRILMRYASFRKDEKKEGKLRNEIAIWKPSYFKFNILSFRFKGNGQKKLVPGDKTGVIQYKPNSKPKFACLGDSGQRIQVQ